MSCVRFFVMRHAAIIICEIRTHRNIRTTNKRSCWRMGFRLHLLVILHVRFLIRGIFIRVVAARWAGAGSPDQTLLLIRVSRSFMRVNSVSSRRIWSITRFTKTTVRSSSSSGRSSSSSSNSSSKIAAAAQAATSVPHRRVEDRPQVHSVL